MGNDINLRHLFLFILAFLLVFAAALPVDVMDVDAAQYASISRDLLKSESWLQITDRGHDYLDKPPLLFWLSASSFSLFGVSNWAYKLPSFLFAILAIFSTVRLGQLLYDRKTGMVAGVMLSSSLGVFIITNDIRTDTILLGTVSFGVWQILLYLKTKRLINLFAGFAGVGLAMLAKGPLGLVIPAMALSCEFAYKRQWKNFVRWQWLVGLGIVAVLLIPMCIGLYQQFDLHPEKVVNGSTGVSGLKFYFWTQSFGRVTGDSDWGTKFDNGAGPFFFTHTFLWAFFPWSLLVLGSLIKTLLTLIRSRFRPGYLPEALTVGGFVLIFLAMSASRYKLPHYIYITFPFAAIMAARFFLHDVFMPRKRYLFLAVTVLHAVFLLALATAALVVLFYVFPGALLLQVVITVIWLAAALLMVWKLQLPTARLLYPLLCGLLALYFVGNTHFYPNLFSYQATATAGKQIAARKVPADSYYYLNDLFQYPGDFYSGFPVMYCYLEDGSLDRQLQKNGYLWLLTDDAGYSALREKGYRFATEQRIDDYPVQFLKVEFLNPKTRRQTLRNRYLLQLIPNN